MITVANYLETVSAQMLTTPLLKKQDEFFKKYIRVYSMSEKTKTIIDEHIAMLNKAAKPEPKIETPKPTPKKEPKPTPKKEPKLTTINYMVYAKEKGAKNFGAMDISKGTIVSNLLYASLIKENQLADLKEKLKEISKENDVHFQIRKAGKPNTTVWEYKYAQAKPKPTPKKPSTPKKPTKAQQTYMAADKRRTFSDDLKLIRSFELMVGKEKTAKSIINMVRTARKNSIERKFNTKSPHYKFVSEIMEKLGKLAEIAEKQSPDTLIKINVQDTDFVAKLKELKAGTALYASIALYKRYINMMGTTPGKEKVQKLKTDIESAFANNKIKANHPYAEELKQLTKSFENYYGGAIDVDATLNGLQSDENEYRDHYFGCTCKKKTLI